MKIFKPGLLILFAFLLTSCNKTTFIELPLLFSDNMVLQQNTNAKVWGKSDPNAQVFVEGSWGINAKCQADATGNWMLELPTIEAGGPYSIKISSGNISKSFSNVLLGEVWVCSGQSNMEMPLISNWAHVNNAEIEASKANYENIRLFTVGKNISFIPIDTMLASGWLICDSNSVKDFSATAYFFGRELYKELNVPIGLINASWGGTVAEAWTSKNGLLNLDDFAAIAEKINHLNSSRDSLKRQFEQDSIEMFKEIQLADKGFDNGVALYAQPGFDDTDWVIVDLPVMWETTSLGNYDGSTWFRKEVDLSQNIANSNLTLTYGAPDDWDEAWFNGVKIGENNEWNVLREYSIPQGLAKAGKNIITIRIYDYTGWGGFMGEPEDFQLISENGSSISIDNGWLAHKGFDFQDIKTIPVSLTEPNQPTVLFNAMINPLIPYTIQGAIWYQGESNAGRAYQYRKLFKTMISDWRAQWKQGDFPFYFVQLANYLVSNTEPVDDTWAELREAQTIALDLSNTGMAVTIDIGDENDIHPGNKQEVGRRLALNALAKTYGKEVAYSGPMYQSMNIVDNKIELAFDNVYDGLQANGNELTGFAIAGENKHFYWANAEIENNKVLVWSNNVSQPVAVRYGWSSNPDCNLENSAGLPASPFRTDDWTNITK